MSLRFEWDREKARENFAKHGVSFAEASTVFADDLSLTIDDPDHSIGEHRCLILGMSHQWRLLVVSHTEEEEDTIRIISARETARAERRRYEEGH